MHIGLRSNDIEISAEQARAIDELALEHTEILVKSRADRASSIADETHILLGYRGSPHRNMESDRIPAYDPTRFQDEAIAFAVEREVHKPGISVTDAAKKVVANVSAEEIQNAIPVPYGGSLEIFTGQQHLSNNRHFILYDATDWNRSIQDAKRIREAIKIPDEHNEFIKELSEAERNYTILGIGPIYQTSAGNNNSNSNGIWTARFAIYLNRDAESVSYHLVDKVYSPTADRLEDLSSKIMPDDYGEVVFQHLSPNCDRESLNKNEFSLKFKRGLRLQPTATEFAKKPLQNMLNQTQVGDYVHFAVIIPSDNFNSRIERKVIDYFKELAS